MKITKQLTKKAFNTDKKVLNKKYIGTSHWLIKSSINDINDDVNNNIKLVLLTIKEKDNFFKDNKETLKKDIKIIFNELNTDQEFAGDITTREKIEDIYKKENKYILLGEQNKVDKYYFEFCYKFLYYECSKIKIYITKTKVFLKNDLGVAVIMKLNEQ